MPKTTPEKGPLGKESADAHGLVVTQPEKFDNLLETISLLDRVSETMGDAKSGDWSGSGGTGETQQRDDGQSARAQAIKNIPDTPQMRKELATYIQKEVKILRKEVRRTARQAYKPGSAYKINKLYAKIRRMNSLMHELMSASLEVLKRLYVRVFIDKQSIT